MLDRLSQPIVGVFDPADGGVRLRDGADSTAGSIGARTGSASPPVLCRLSGVLDDTPRLARELGLPSDADPEELLAAGYASWGASLPARLRGDFVILLWDRERREGLLARDQLGVRCLYLHAGSGRVRFATELHELLALLRYTPSPDRTGVAHWIAAGARPGPGTLFDGVTRLSPGAMLLLDRRGVRERTYWRPRFRAPSPCAPPEAAERVLAALRRSIGRRLAGAERVGVLMSGGLDSASVAALACADSPRLVRAYAGVFPLHPAVDESQLIAELRGRLRMPCTLAEVVPGGLVRSALDAARVSRLPLLGWGDFWTAPLLAAAAGDGVQLTLGGDGGDELFGPRVQLLADLLRRGRLRGALNAARRLPGAGSRPPRRAVASLIARHALADGLPPALGDLLARRAARRDAPAWLLPATARALAETSDRNAWAHLDGPRWWSYAAHGLTRGIEHAGIFEHQRLRAASAGLQARHPLFDLDLLELVLDLPPELSLDPFRNRPLLRAAMAGLLPDSVRLRAAKAWFDSLIVDSLTGADAPVVRALLCDPTAEIGSYVKLDGVRAMLDAGPDGPSGRFRWMHLVWRLVSAECWLRELAGRSVAPAARASVVIDAPGPSKLESAVFQP